MKKMFIKNINILMIAILLSSFTIASTLSLSNREMATKLEIETNLEEKVVNVISKIYDRNKFAVTTNVSLISPNGITTSIQSNPLVPYNLRAYYQRCRKKMVLAIQLIQMITEFKFRISQFGLTMISIL